MGTDRLRIFGIIYYFLLLGQLGTNYYFVFGYHVFTESYDFIVVGAGTAGCAVAARLSESGQHSVLLLEAGGYPDPNTEVRSFVNDPNHSKRFPVVPQENAALQNNGSMTYIIGRTLGGGSTINGMVFNRGHPNDYKNWEKLTNDPSWNYWNVLKYFKRSEDYLGDFPSDNQHGFGGPIPVSSPEFSSHIPSQQTYYEAGQWLGYPIADPNGPQRISFAPSDRSVRNNRRVSSFKGYLENVFKTRQNLKITTNAFAKRILFDGNNAAAIGVVYISEYNSSLNVGGNDVFVRANKEIILSSGAIESPVLLQRSGIGPQEILQENGIPPVKILPAVGSNLQDHPLFRLGITINDGGNPFLNESAGVWDAALFVQAFMASAKAFEEEGSGVWPDIFVQFTSGLPTTLANGSREVSIICQIFVARPKSRGFVKINPNNPAGDPILDFKYFSDSDDLDVMVDGIKKVLEVYEKTPPLKRYGGRFNPPILPACDQFPFRSDAYFKCLIRQRSLTGLHAAGSCAMGNGEDDPKAVVNSALKVVGIKGLRIVDGSVIPKLTNANLEAPIYMIAEKAADQILESWRETSAAAAAGDRILESWRESSSSKSGWGRGRGAVRYYTPQSWVRWGSVKQH